MPVIPADLCSQYLSLAFPWNSFSFGAESGHEHAAEVRIRHL